MNKKILLMCSMALCAGVIATGVFASQNDTFQVFTMDNVQLSESTAITNALNNSNVLRGFLSPTMEAGDDIDEIETVALNSIQSYNVQNITDNNEAISANNAIKLYTLSVEPTTTSIYTSTNENNDKLIIPMELNNSISFIYMKKGENVNTVTEKINQLNVSEETKSRMRQKAIQREGNWYVSCIEEQYSYDKAKNFVNGNTLSELLYENNISDITDLKYVYINNNDILTICVKTNTNEYIIPYVFENRSDGLQENTLYAVSDFIEIVTES